MKEFLEKNKWVVVLCAIAAVGVAVFSAIRSLNLMGTKMPTTSEALKIEEQVHTRLQKELQEKYGIAPKRWGVTDTGEGKATPAGTPIPLANRKAAEQTLRN